MSKKLFITILTILTFAFSFTYVFATNGTKDAVQSVRNVVGDAENVVEDTAKDVSNATKDFTGGVENDAKNITDNNMDNNNKNTTAGTNARTNSYVDNSAYTATRTSTDNPTFMGMSSTAWTWLILGIAAVAIIALVWYYSMQLTGTNYDNKNDD
jgi:hypothetical protein